jgi:protein required for attachment to host cells
VRTRDHSGGNRYPKRMEHSIMNNCCVVVADAARARVYILEKAENLQAGSRLVQKAQLEDTEYMARGTQAPRVRSERNTNRQAGPVHPFSEKRERHRLVIEERFARDITRKVQKLTRDWKAGVLLLVAEPRMLGLVREPLRSALKDDIELKELAKDYMHFTPSELQQKLSLHG